MKKIKMAKGTTLTFEEGCNKYLEYCRQRNLRQGTVNLWANFLANICRRKSRTVRVS